jgi:hypothetical protein
MAITQIAGFAGAALAGAAYVPQISHLVTARATPAEHSGPLRPYVPVLHPHSHAVTEFQATHLRGRT